MKASLFYPPTYRQPCRDRAGMAGMTPHYCRRMLADLTEQINSATSPVTIRCPSPSITSTSRVSTLRRPGAPRPLLRDADQAHAGRPTRHRPDREPDPRRRRHRHARPHDRRPPDAGFAAATSGAGLTSWRSRPTASTAHCPTSTTRSTTPIGSPSKELPHLSRSAGPRRC